LPHRRLATGFIDLLADHSRARTSSAAAPLVGRGTVFAKLLDGQSAGALRLAIALSAMSRWFVAVNTPEKLG